jgi:hypothetical protein
MTLPDPEVAVIEQEEICKDDHLDVYAKAPETLASTEPDMSSK